MAMYNSNGITNENTVSKLSAGGYFSEVTVARGVALILVILGHSFPDGDTGVQNFIGLWIRTWLYSFHMGVFFALSGFVMARRLYSGSYSLIDEVKKRAVRLLIPYFVYSFITIVPKIVLSAYVNNPYNISELWTLFVGNSPNGGMWFLWHLFFVTVLFLAVFKMLRNTENNTKNIIAICVGLGLYCLYVALDANYLSRTLEYAIFFAIGIVVNHYYENIKMYFKPVVACACILATIVVACPALDFEVTYLFSGILGIYGLCTIAICVDKNNNRFTIAFSYLGKLSYEIYLLSYFVQIPIRIIAYSILELPYIVCLLGMFIGGIFVPIVASWILGKSKVCSLLLLGRPVQLTLKKDAH